MVRQRGPLNFPTTHYLSRPASVIPQADVIIGLELTDYLGHGNAYTDNNAHGVGTNVTQIKPGTKLISISTLDLMTKSNYQEFQRFQSVDVPIAGDVEATLPSLIEAVKSAIAERPQGCDRQARRRDPQGTATRDATPPGRLPPSPGMRARSAPRGWSWRPTRRSRTSTGRWSPTSGNTSNWPQRLWPMDKHYHWTRIVRRLRRRLGRAGRRSAARSPTAT